MTLATTPEVRDSAESLGTGSDLDAHAHGKRPSSTNHAQSKSRPNWWLSLVRGHWITLRRALLSFLPASWRSDGALNRLPEGWHEISRTGPFTVSYPEESLPVTERFRVLPVLIYDEDDGQIRCTSCDICARVCPPQCLWIEQAVDTNGKGIPAIAEFILDADLCMNCGLCAEYCPFDAIKMDHQFALSNYERHTSHILTMADLLVSSDYYAQTHPIAWSSEGEVAERAKLEKKKQKRLTGPPAKKSQSTPQEEAGRVSS